MAFSVWRYAIAYMGEFAFMKEVLQAFGRGTTRLFRVNCGTTWQGREIEHTAKYLTLENPRPVHGMPAGSADLIGWQTITITPDMVGQQVAVFVAVETKALCGRVTPAQQTFLRTVREAGGRAVAARSLAEVAGVLGPPAGPASTI